MPAVFDPPSSWNPAGNATAASGLSQGRKCWVCITSATHYSQIGKRFEYAYDTDSRSERSFPWIERFYFNDDSPVLNPGVHGANFGAWNARKQFSLLSLANLTHS